MNNTEVAEQILQRQETISLLWSALSTYFIFLMQIGFAFLHVGTIRFKFTQSALIKKAINVSVSCLVWWLWGLGISFGSSENQFIGGSLYADSVFNGQQYGQWLFHFAYAITCNTIFSGCLAERLKLLPYLLFNCVLVGFIYPVAVHWTWADGFLRRLAYHDFSGSGIIHLIGGTAGLAGGLILGPRKGRFESTAKYRKQEFLPSNMGFIAFGTFTLWIGWYGMNCGTVSPLMIDRERTSSEITSFELIGKVAINSTLAPSVCGFTVFMLHYLANRDGNNAYSLKALCDGILAGLVSISADCDNVKPWASFLIALMAGFLYHFSKKIEERLHFDDSMNVLPIHMICGIWGSLMVGWFDEHNGILYGSGGRQFGVQILACLVIFAWTFSLSFGILYLFKRTYFIGLRISSEEEETGSDVLHFGGLALIMDIDHLRITKGEITLRGKKIRLAASERHLVLDTQQNCRISSELFGEDFLKKYEKSYDIVSNDLVEMMGNINKVS